MIKHHYIFVFIFLFAALPAFSSLAEKRPEPVVFIENMAESGFAFLDDKTLTAVDRRQKFRSFLTTYFGTQTIGKFVIGRHWKTMTDAQKEEYLVRFENYLVNVYQRRFGDYKGQSFKVLKSIPAGERDFIVHSIFEQSSSQSIPIEWRIRTSSDSYQIIDVIVSGVSMAMTQRSDFSSFIQRNGGNIDKFLEFLKQFNQENKVGE